ncbi:isocitrate lyase/PEP mutase family protein [Marilutibacter chinensis]|uniref:Isocitrate lyase/phosphoenolpyruvate mutase family protein n=1 Tax=Marilutibacter chinensis TaxID=2912247 RepID=A0ABS9HQM3_9GAMM|nr:isocitrate lyase/phosphoenolpyruvate mutase family protein [Lysobacter chinensis]MCF7221244.1 isocitrate lyase/phosphoenolpyruvate mutase family protein [Lysobacter chinensis]MCF7223015.1 isocitrate lyase/phosphoenolpyruvate mutase family protein [Lysobacter chinensis]
MSQDTHADLHARFAALHRSDAPLLIANAWDAASAALWQHAGAPAIGTSSAAMAWACGHADGGALPRTALMDKVREIVRVTTVPVSIDVEDGYSDDPEAVAALVREVAEAGAVGINLEDGAGTPESLARKIRAIRAALDGMPLFVNARTDVYLRGMADGEQAVAMTLERLALYAEAGADGAFVPCIADGREIAAVAAGTALPLNVMAMPGLPPLAELQRAGVRRVSAGEGVFQHAFAAGLQAVRGFLGGDTARRFDNAVPYGELNALFARAG